MSDSDEAKQQRWVNTDEIVVGCIGLPWSHWTSVPRARRTSDFKPALRPLIRSEFSWLQGLEDAADEITREMGALQRAGKGSGYQGGTGEMSTVYDATQGWGTMRIRYMGRCVDGTHALGKITRHEPLLLHTTRTRTCIKKHPSSQFSCF